MLGRRVACDDRARAQRFAAATGTIQREQLAWSLGRKGKGEIGGKGGVGDRELNGWECNAVREEQIPASY